MSDTPPGNPQSRGDKRPSSRPGAQAASFLTHLTEVRKLDPRRAEAAAVSVISGLLLQFEPGEDQESDHLTRKLVELLPVRPASAPEPKSQAPAQAAAPAEATAAAPAGAPVQELAEEPEGPGLLERVAEAMGPGVDVEPVVRAVFQGLREYLSDVEALEVERGLTWELQHLWRRTQ